MASRKRPEGSIKTVGPNKHRLRLCIGYVPDPQRPGATKRQYVTETIIGTTEEAKARLAELVSLKHNRPQALARSSVTARDYLQDWLDNVDPLNVRLSTHRAHVSMMSTYVMPAFGRRRLRDITTADVDGLIQALLKAGKSPSTIRYCVSMLSVALERARKIGLIPTNPVSDATRPRLNPAKNQAFTPTELMRFLTAALEHRLHGVLLFLLATTSLRPSEAYGLAWSDVDLRTGVIRVRRTVVRFKGGYKYDKPKTSRGARAVLLSPHTTYLLAAWAHHLGPREADDLVFPNTQGKPLHGGYVFHAGFEKVIERAGLPRRRMYDLRHSHATWLATSKVSPRVVSERLGHASSALTLDVYTGVNVEMQSAAADATEELFGKEFRLSRPEVRVTKELRERQKQFDKAYWAYAAELLQTPKPPRDIEALLPD